MRIALLSRNRRLYSSRRLIEAAEARGHEVQVIDVLRCYMNIVSANPSVHLEGEELSGFDAVIPRIGASVTANRLHWLVRETNCAHCNCYPEKALVCLSQDLPISRAILAI